MRSLVRRGEFRAVVVVGIVVVGWPVRVPVPAPVLVLVLVLVLRLRHGGGLFVNLSRSIRQLCLRWADDEPSRADESQVGQIMVCQVNLEQQPLQLPLPSQQ